MTIRPLMKLRRIGRRQRKEKRNGEVAAVLDMDSPVFDRVSEDDRVILEGIVEAMEQLLEW